MRRLRCAPPLPCPPGATKPSINRLTNRLDSSGSETKTRKNQTKQSGVPGMIARLLGANVVLTEQDELLSLLDRNLADNFKGGLGEGIRHAALDWERKEDTDEILASLNPYAAAQPGRSCSSDNISEEGAAGQRPPTRLDFVLCAE